MLPKSVSEKIMARHVADASMTSTAAGFGGDISEIFTTMLDRKNMEPLAILDGPNDAWELSILNGLLNCGNKYDLAGFISGFYESFLTLSVARDGIRSEQLKDIAAGWLGFRSDIERERAKRDTRLEGVE